MKLKVTRVNVWAASIADKPGGLANKLEPLRKAGANIEFIIARRAPERPGTGVVFVTPVRGAKQERAAAKADFVKTDTLHSIRVEGKDQRGVGAKITRALASGGINLRGLSAAAIGKRFVAYLALDSAAAASKAVKVLKSLK
jgi:hypothetical protein